LPELWTIGHGTVQPAEFAGYLERARVARLVDVCRFPSSRRNPQFAAPELERTMTAAGIAYARAEGLGGRRRPATESPNRGLRNEGFRGYADWMRTDAFRGAFEELTAAAARERIAIMCAETPWWKCHRRLIADAAVLLAGYRVTHLIKDKASPHVLTSGVAVDSAGRLVYPPPA
jgi:uncharacterized protein (DUF488 family)